MANPNGTPFADVLELARGIAAVTLVEGGGTFNADSGEAVTFSNGEYLVGGAQVPTKVRVEAGEEALAIAIAKHVQRIPRDSQGKVYFLGTWIWNGVCYIDSSEAYLGRSVAKKVGRERKELAIYDTQEGESIDL